MADHVPVVVVPTVTKLDQSARGAVVIGGSHAAIFTTYLTVAAGAHAAIQHDACIGREQAGISGLGWAEQFGFAMAAVAGESARIGDGQDMRRRGVISAANRFAHAAGVRPGMRCEDAAAILQTAPPPTAAASPLSETRSIVAEGGKEIVVVELGGAGTARRSWPDRRHGLARRRSFRRVCGGDRYAARPFQRRRFRARQSRNLVIRHP